MGKTTTDMQLVPNFYYKRTVFVDGEKIYEAHPGESYEECYAAVEKAFKVACS